MTDNVLDKKSKATHALPDVQSSEDTRAIAINKVGIKDIRHPYR